jgi:hypothetical protein
MTFYPVGFRNAFPLKYTYTTKETVALLLRVYRSLNMASTEDPPAKANSPPNSPRIADPLHPKPTSEPEKVPTEPPTEADAPRKQHKRKSGNSVDLTFRYYEPSDDELSWTEDEHGNRRQRKSRKRKSGGGDDFRTGIVYCPGFVRKLMII